MTEEQKVQNQIQQEVIDNKDNASELSYHKKKKEPERIETQISGANTMYKGQVLKEKKDGYGVETHMINKTEYQGYWKDNYYDGEGIFLQQKTHCFFKGLWVEGQKKAGIEIFPNGDQYEGEYLNDKYHGKGCLHNTTINYRYEGDFINGMRDGQGVETYSSGAYYTGYFKNNQKHGKGILNFPDKSYYEGDFVCGVPCGFGVYVAFDQQRAKSIMPNIAYLKKLEEQKEKEKQQNSGIDNQHVQKVSYKEQNQDEEEDDLGLILHDTQKNQDQDKEPEEYYYEGEFVEGYKHGIGRQYDPNGSYYYCRWEFDKKVGEILYYNALIHKWRIYKYKSGEIIADDYQRLDQYPIKNQIENIIPEESGFPPDEFDAHKSKIDECGIQGEQFEDSTFQPTEEFIEKNLGSHIKDLPPLEFLRISETDCLDYGKRNLYENPIQPGQIVVNEYSDYQLLTIFEILSKYPYLLSKVFSVKYELETVCYITIKLFIQGQWQEIIVDDYLPILRLNREPLFSTTNVQGKDRELGWLVLQKAFCKIYQKYFYYFQEGFPKKAKEYLQLLTGLPCKSLEWHNVKPSRDAKQGNAQLQDIQNKVWKSLNSTKNPAKIAIAYPRDEICRQFQILDTSSYIIQHIEKFEDEQGLLETQYLIVQQLSEHNKIQSEESHYFNNESIKKMMENFKQKHKYNQDNFTIYSIREFCEIFGEVHILVGMQQQVQNTYRIQSTITDFVNNDHRFYTQFSVNLPTKAVINIQQHPKIIDGVQEDMFPVRMILSSQKDAFANSKKEYIQKKIINQLTQDVKKHKSINEQDSKSSLSPMKKQQSVAAMEKQNEQMEANQAQQKTTTEDLALKKKNLPYKYVFGKGQKKQENLFKNVELETGIYVLLLQVEGPDAQEGQDKQKKSVDIDITISIFSESLINIQHLEEPENYLRQLYEQCILDAEIKSKKDRSKSDKPDKHLQFFSRSDLQDREKGCHDLIITQYFLKWEGTYLQYLQNQSNDKTQKSWRQKLYFRTENMKILDQNDPHKVDEYLLPQQEALIIIQQQGAKNFNLEGGEGICIIEKIGKNKQEDNDEDDDDDQMLSMKGFTKKLHDKNVEKKNKGQEDIDL